MREASSRIAMTMLKIRTARGEDSSGRSAEPNIAQAEQDRAQDQADADLDRDVQGKAAIAA